MNVFDIYHFLFETYYGLGILVLAGLLLTGLASVVMERRLRKRFKDREKESDDESWSLFEDDEEEETEADESEKDQ